MKRLEICLLTTILCTHGVVFVYPATVNYHGEDVPGCEYTAAWTLPSRNEVALSENTNRNWAWKARMPVVYSNITTGPPEGLALHMWPNGTNCIQLSIAERVDMLKAIKIVCNDSPYSPYSEIVYLNVSKIEPDAKTVVFTKTGCFNYILPNKPYLLRINVTSYPFQKGNSKGNTLTMDYRVYIAPTTVNLLSESNHLVNEVNPTTSLWINTTALLQVVKTTQGNWVKWTTVTILLVVVSVTVSVSCLWLNVGPQTVSGFIVVEDKDMADSADTSLSILFDIDSIKTLPIEQQDV